jgi:glyoxylase-like metal-dependent hydrolase (beta-lactamase superfamily II)
MQRERIADDIYIFTSERYAQVTAGALISSEGAILIDTLVFPEETRAIKSYIEGRLNSPVRYVINTHYHADHTYGTYMFPSATVVSHARCFDLLDTRGREGLAESQRNGGEFANVQIVLPHYVFNRGLLEIKLGNKTLQMWHTPGHSMDSMVCLAKEDRVLFAADTLMPVPYFVDGDYDDFVASLKSLQNNSFENIIQGHGEIILKGEIEAKIAGDLAYLEAIKRFVEAARTMPDPVAYLDGIDIEQCGKSRIPLNGSVRDLHRANLHALYRQLNQPVIEPD